MEFNDYVRSRFDAAKEGGHFDASGNSDLATYNRGFAREFLRIMKEKIAELPSAFIDSVKGFLLSTFVFLVMISLPVTMIPLVILLAKTRMKRAEKELLKEFARAKVKAP